MRKFILEIAKCEKQEKVNIHPHNTPSAFNSCLCRQSPIYSISDTPVNPIFLPEQESHILFLYTLRSFETIGRLLRLSTDPEISNRVYITHGIASVVILAPDYEFIHSYLASVDGLIIGYEHWVINTDYLVKSTDNICTKYNHTENCKYELDIDSLPIDSQNIFRGIIISLNQAHALSSIYAKQYIYLFDNAHKLCQELVLKLLFLKGKISEEVFESRLRSNNSSWDEIDIKKQISNNIRALNNDKERIVRIHQLKDETIQLSAILQNILRQGFGATCPITSSTYESGEHSLLGIGGMYSALVAINIHINKSFSVCSDVESIAEYLKEQPSPAFPDQNNLAAWRQKLHEYPGISKAIPHSKHKEQSSHLVYFSNRLGFRETKHSITAAMQSIMLSSLPSWNMCTIFHEYMHAHVRALFSQIYPYNSINSSERFNSAFDKYTQRINDDEKCDNLFEFLQTSFLSAISDLSEFSNVSPSISKEAITSAIRECHHSINEIIVHIIDYSYFYEFKNEVYVKGIWSSWVKLPFIYSRIHEYLLRTICAVASNERGTEEEVFDRSVEIIITNLKSLIESQPVDNLLLKEVIKHLEDTEIIQIQFYNLYPLIYIVKHFLISSQVKESFADPDASFVDDDENLYSLELTPGVFEDRCIGSPITFLQEFLGNCFRSKCPNDSISEVEFITLWLFSVVSSSLPGDKEE